ncbi:MAG: hypothetical protein U0V56_08205 [Actinomycetota bacterium]
MQTFLVFWFGRVFGASAAGLMGVVFFASGLLQAASSIASGRIAARLGLLPTMVFTHLPSNVLLILVPFAPSLGVVALWLTRCSLSQMDVPARQAYVVTLVDPQERLAASAYTNTARYVSRPIAPAIARSLQTATAAPFTMLAGSLKIVYDLALFVTFRRVDPP